MPVEKRFLPLKLDNVRQHCVRLLSRSQIQILLYQHYGNTTSPYAFPFPFTMETLRCTLAIVITSMIPFKDKQAQQEEPNSTNEKKNI